MSVKREWPLWVGGQLNHRLVYVCSGNSNLKVQGYLAEKQVCFLVDSEAAISVVCSDLLSGSQLKSVTRTSVGLEAIGANGLPLNVCSQIRLPMIIESVESEHDFLVAKNLPVEFITILFSYQIPCCNRLWADGTQANWS